MGEFTPITTQEDFDKAISERLKRERETLTKKYADYDDILGKNKDLTAQNTTLSQALEEATGKIKGHDKEMAEQTGKIKNYETASVKTRIANELGLPYKLADRLSGESEDDIRKDAEGLLGLIKKNQPVPPLADPEPEPSEKNNKMAAMKTMLQNMKGE